ncbi:Glutamyl-tRNA amidotransferase B subunit [Metschnikowia bicuspidata var. bicuspidata NRRL YB-4993]|uniref:Glutamyl-tRNA(Gln) amidotransferase subunit B, mitochondrial n=1 Tax=Metschnikowia bicuspidata var. bicuspidata NRRL YB-4993 TaxID=869754 RepID=A0A1A0HAN9_9ASCO|nr:Glutamyl-tRNA amidotransferase B subunit [Metschnikowia bicuspidata var. bicuspidata NRRL YB-4993]OBA20942.1 Glutamyl-tRNA amidotransferase B subunit [Metschnikowia bicuspidata var. bicuspidata NRRL YB-4993]
MLIFTLNSSYIRPMIPKSLQKWRPEPGFPFKCGLEIHTQLKTKHKLFSLSRNAAEGPPNSNTSYFDVGLPGTFPKLNPEALLLALKAAAVLKSRVNPISSFDRKHYFYLDQPLGYQITQHYRPLANGGSLQLTRNFDDVLEDKTIGIEQIQIEQDTAKLNYDAFGQSTAIDFNRANVPLIELVTKPDFNHLLQVRAFVKKYIGIMTHLGVCSGDMENGAMRCDVNVSVAGGNRVEIKNLGSTSEIAAAVIYEYARQVNHLKSSALPIEQETRAWNGKETVRTRSKEDAVDYRYFPDTELPLVHLKPEITQQISAMLPDLPDQIVEKLMLDPFLLEKKHAKFLVESRSIHAYYMDIHDILVSRASGCLAKTLNNWFFHNLLGTFKKFDQPVDPSVLPADKFASLIMMVQNNEISLTSAKLILTALIQSPETTQSLSIREMVDHYDLGAPADLAEGEFENAVRDICLEIIDNHPDVVETVRKGKHKSIKFLIGQAMRETQGKVDSRKFDQCFTSLLLGRKD